MNDMNSAQEPTPKEVEAVEKMLNKHIKASQERHPGYAFHYWEASIAGIPQAASAIVEHYCKVMEEKDREVVRMMEIIYGMRLGTSYEMCLKILDEQTSAEPLPEI